MTVTVKFATRMTPSTIPNTGPKIDEVPDETLDDGVEVQTSEGWLLVLNDSRQAIAAYCPGSVLRAEVDSPGLVPAADPVPAAPVEAPALPVEAPAMPVSEPVAPAAE